MIKNKNLNRFLRKLSKMRIHNQFKQKLWISLQKLPASDNQNGCYISVLAIDILNVLILKNSPLYVSHSPLYITKMVGLLGVV
jgi:hypothetical protein